MIDISSANLAAVEAEMPWPIDFAEMIIDITDPNMVLRLSNHFHDIDTRSVISPDSDVTYTAVASLLGFSNVSNDLEAKDNSFDISLSGMDPEIVAMVLASPIEGSIIYMYRGFYDQEAGELHDIPYQRWAGRVNNFSIQDDYSSVSEDKVVISISCTSLLNTLLDRVAGRYTNNTSQQYFHPGDNSMEFVAGIVNFAPNFGKGQWNPPPPPPPSGGGGKHLCTRYWEFGDITDEVFEADNAYREKVDDEFYNWYSKWAEPLAASIEKGSWKYYVCLPFVRAWSDSMAYKMGITDNRSRFGELLEVLGYYISRFKKKK